jgi:hypothetical protein
MNKSACKMASVSQSAHKGLRVMLLHLESLISNGREISNYINAAITQRAANG